MRDRADRARLLDVALRLERRSDAEGGSFDGPDCASDGGALATQWAVALLTLGLVAFLQAHRFARTLGRTGPEGLWREVTILALALTGLGLFWREVQACRFFGGIMQLFVFLVLANVVTPWLWRQPRPLDDCGGELEEPLDEAEDGETPRTVYR